MKSLMLRLALIACVIGIVAEGTMFKAQPESPQVGQELAASQARERLSQAAGELEALLDSIKPDSLKTAAGKFVDAAKKPEEKQKLNDATTALGTALNNARKRAKQQKQEFIEGVAVKAIENAIAASNALSSAPERTNDSSQTNGSTSQSKKAGDTETQKTDQASESFLAFVWPIAGGVAVLGLIVLAVFGILRLRSGFWLKLDGHVNEIVSAHVGGVKKRHDEMAKHLSAIGEDQRKTSSRLESIEGEIQVLGRRLRQGGLESGGYQGASVRQAFDEFARPPLLQPVEPEFPASADEYLNKMKRNSIVVRPDFQNGILVNDIDGKGELVLIRDSSIPDDAQPLFLVPRVTQFQTKQEFLSYYERYYDCQRPSAGDVWIIDPAIVSTVPGGWELREKGVLEVR